MFHTMSNVETVSLTSFHFIHHKSLDWTYTQPIITLTWKFEFFRSSRWFSAQDGVPKTWLLELINIPEDSLFAWMSEDPLNYLREAVISL